MPDAADRLRALKRGAEAEELVAEQLAAAGWTVLARNWRGGGGEIDVVALRDARLRFVEVKLRLPEDELADDAVGFLKQQRLRRAALAWLAEHGETAEEHCFLVAFVDASVEPWAIQWIDNAFDC